MIKVGYAELVNRLERELSISFTTTEDPAKVKRKISMAKHREGIAGKLIFSYTETEALVEGEKVVAYCITAVLTAKKNELSILKLNTDEKHKL